MKTKKEYTDNELLKMSVAYQKSISSSMSFFKTIAIIGIVLWLIGVVISL